MAGDGGVDRRREILDAALAIVRDGDLAGLTITALTERSGASNGSIYHHFGSRQGVIATLYRDSFSQCIASLLPALDGGAPEVVVTGLARRYLDWIEHHPARSRFLYAASAQRGASPEADDLPAFKQDVFAPIAAWFADRMERGDLRQVPLWALDPVVMGPAHECARRFLIDEDADLEPMREQAAAAAWAIVRPT